jgi:putative glutamate/gamma-aminobutyrate antiporter
MSVTTAPPVMPRATPASGKPRTVMSVPTIAMLTAAAIVTSLRGLPLMAEEELTMFTYIAFATVLFLLPAALVSAELGGAFADRKGGVYAWVGEAFGPRWGFVAVWLQWIQNVVWYPTALGFAAAAAAFAVHRSSASNNNIFVGLFCIGAYWLATLVALRGNTVLAKVTKYGFLAGTILPGVILLALFVYWAASGHPIGWAHAHNAAVSHSVNGHPSPRWFPNVAGLGTLSFLAGILLLFSGVEIQAVHAEDMRDPRRGFPKAIFIAAFACFAVFTLGALAVAGILPYDKITLQSGVFDAFTAPLSALGISWAGPLIAALVCYGALGGALAWLSGPSRALLVTAEDGCLPPVLQRTNSHGAQRNILIVQGFVVTAISAIYLVMKNVSSAFFLISALVVGLYILMYMLVFAAAIRLRYTRPDLPRNFRIPGGNAGMWAVAGTGFSAVGFALVLAFVPPSQLPIGNPTSYVAIVAAGTVLFTALPLLIHRLRRPSWRVGHDDHPASRKPKPRRRASAVAGSRVV